jgi:hypothetical protein
MADGERLMSHIDRAASLPQDAPHILSVDESVPISSEEAACVIDIADFEDALRDPKVQAFTREAIAYGKQLQAEGRDLTGTDEL